MSEHVCMVSRFAHSIYVSPYTGSPELTDTVVVPYPAHRTCSPPSKRWLPRAAAHRSMPTSAPPPAACWRSWRAWGPPPPLAVRQQTWRTSTRREGSGSCWCWLRMAGGPAGTLAGLHFSHTSLTRT